MLHGRETWPVRKENEVALQRAEMRIVRWMRNIKVKGKVPSEELREKLGIEVYRVFGCCKGVHVVCGCVGCTWCVWVCRVVLRVYVVCGCVGSS